MLKVRSNILSTFVNLLATLRSEYSFDDQTIIGCPTQEQLAAILASVMVVHVSNRSRILHSNSREVSESPEPLTRKMSMKSVKFQDNANESTSNVEVNECERDVRDIPCDNSNVVTDSVPVTNGNIENNGTEIV